MVDHRKVRLGGVADNVRLHVHDHGAGHLAPSGADFCFIDRGKQNTKKNPVRVLTVGAAVALYYSYRLVFYDMHAEIGRMHIIYQSAAPGPFGKHFDVVLSDCDDSASLCFQY